MSKTLTFFLILATVAIVGLVYSAGTHVNVIVLSDVNQETDEKVIDKFAFEEGVYCDFQGCCSDDVGGGISMLNLETGEAICKNGDVAKAESCFCERKEIPISHIINGRAD